MVAIEATVEAMLDSTETSRQLCVVPALDLGSFVVVLEVVCW